MQPGDGPKAGSKWLPGNGTKKEARAVGRDEDEDRFAGYRIARGQPHFPGPYVFKAIGKVENGFVARVVAAVREELAGAMDPPFKVRSSVGGRHVSVTLEPTVQTARQALPAHSGDCRAGDPLVTAF
jgi:putative lipoic acid-binding regulatory protein